MRRARSVIGLPIISLAEGLRVGRVQDLIFDPAARSVAALLVREASWHREAELVPIAKVRSFGRDAITIYDLSGLIAARANRQLYDLYASTVKLEGLLVMTEGGSYLGIIEDIRLGPRGEMVAYEISIGFTEDVQRGRCLIPAADALTVGRDVATFPDGTEQHLTRELEASEITAETRNGDVLVLQTAS